MNRRDMFRGIGGGAVAGWLAPRGAAAPAGAHIYQGIGVEPIVNCKGTYTIISGSQTLPEVKRAMDEASRHYVHLDELMAAVSRRLAELTKAEWGIVTAGCAAALTHATAACIAGADPEKMQRMGTDLTGMKNEVVIPRESRNVYDHAVRMLGVRVVTAGNRDEFLAALRPSVALVMLLGEELSRHPMKLEEMIEAAHQQHIPVIVDAAAERPTIPDVYLTRGADMVGYSGGKCLRGPQCAGLLLGRKDLLEAAWANSAPHHAFGRSLKVGKEEIMGMLAAVEAWTRRDHQAEWRQWEAWLGTVREKVSGIPTVKTEIELPRKPSNYAPTLRVSWDVDTVGASGAAVADALLNGRPRVGMLNGANSVTIMPYMMMPGDDQIAARRLYEVLTNPPRAAKPAVHPSNAVLSGQWEAHLSFVRGEATHHLALDEKDGAVTGEHRGEFLSGPLHGTREGDRVTLHTAHRYEGTSLSYRFEGTLAENSLSGTVDLGEYGKVPFTARRT